VNRKYYIFEDPGGRVRYCCQQDPAIPRNPDDILRYSKSWRKMLLRVFAKKNSIEIKKKEHYSIKKIKTSLKKRVASTREFLRHF
jgi:hypothetical protein